MNVRFPRDAETGPREVRAGLALCALFPSAYPDLLREGDEARVVLVGAPKESLSSSVTPGSCAVQACCSHSNIFSGSLAQCIDVGGLAASVVGVSIGHGGGFYSVASEGSTSFFRRELGNDRSIRAGLPGLIRAQGHGANLL